MSIELIRGLTNLNPAHRGCVLTIGNFDGVHLGHQALLKNVKNRAKDLNLPSMVMTFEPHAIEFFAPEKCAPRLTRWREKFCALAECGIDRVLVVRFDEHFANLSADEFVQHILVEKLGVKHVFIGDDFHFGHDREGDFEFLKKMGEKLGFGVENMTTLQLNSERISSSLVRAALKSADHAKVQALLGHPYTMMGRVVYGDRRGHILGFPTANIYLHRAVTPVQGVYAVRMHGIAEHSLPGVANVGIRPTFGGTRSLLEVHLFNFNQNIYGQHVSVEFCKKLREEIRFENFELLKEQIWRDAKEAREFFGLAEME